MTRTRRILSGPAALALSAAGLGVGANNVIMLGGETIFRNAMIWGS